MGTAAPYEVVVVAGVRIGPFPIHLPLLTDIQVNVPVKLRSEEQNVTVNPGDYIIGDLNGVICLPRELAEKAVALLAPQAEADRLIAIDLQAGVKFADASTKNRARLTKP